MDHHDNQKAHPILSQVPLIISPFLHLPKAVTLPFNFNKLPSSLPNPSVTLNAVEYIVKDSEQLSHFITTQHNQRIQNYDNWLENVVQRDLQEKRKIAPGYLDTGKKILQPMKKAEVHEVGENSNGESGNGEAQEKEKGNEINEIDLVFGRVTLNNQPEKSESNTN